MITSAKLWLWTSPLLIVLAAIGFWRNKGNTHFRLLMASAAITFIESAVSPDTGDHGHHDHSGQNKSRIAVEVEAAM